VLALLSEISDPIYPAVLRTKLFTSLFLFVYHDIVFYCAIFWCNKDDDDDDDSRQKCLNVI